MNNSGSRKKFKILPKPPTMDSTKNIVPPLVHNTFTNISNGSVISSGDRKFLKIAPKPPSTLKPTSSTRPKQRDLADLSFRREGLRQTNALPPYWVVPPPITVISSDVNFCPYCGDTFSLISNLALHLERRSVLIKFPCDMCQVTKIFYNRCNLLSHIRSHSNNNESVEIRRAVANPLSHRFMDMLRSELPNTLEELNNKDDSNSIPPTELLESVNEIGQNSAIVRQEFICPPMVKCFDCYKEFDNVEERKKHLTNDDKISSTIFKCNTCGMFCPSKCHLKAHQRIHLQVSPYVCPECGDRPECGDCPNFNWNKFQHHVIYKCFHNARGIGYKCPMCKQLFPSNELLLKHMELHMEKYLKCLACVRVYSSIASLEAHIKEFHTENTMVLIGSAIYKCSLCDMFLTNDQMRLHCSTHLESQVCEYVFNCKQCGKNVESKVLLLEHIKSSHSILYRYTMQYANIIPTETKQELTRPTVIDKVNCILCNCSYRSLENYSVHFNRAHINQPCCLCHMIIGNRKLHGKGHLMNGHAVCLLCNNKTFNTKKALIIHLLYHVSKLQCCSVCPICNKLMPTKLAAFKHLYIEHSLNEENSTSPDGTKPDPQNIICHFCRNSFAKDEDLQEHLRAKHSLGHPRQPIDLAAFQEIQPTIKPRLEGNKCAKCDFQSTDRKAFKQHLVTHKANKSTFQCQECGLCFVVEPALAKHLFIVHRISNTKKYLEEEEGSNFMPDTGEAAEVSHDSFICSVCFETFTKEIALKAHRRRHGMAFIQNIQSKAAN